MLCDACPLCIYEADGECTRGVQKVKGNKCFLFDPRDVNAHRLQDVPGQKLIWGEQYEGED